jgi:hypothetical protein
LAKGSGEKRDGGVSFSADEALAYLWLRRKSWNAIIAMVPVMRIADSGFPS